MARVRTGMFGKRLFLLMALGLFAVMAFAACDDDADDGGNGAEAPATATAESGGSDDGDGGDGGSVAVVLSEWAVAPSPTSVDSGAVVLTAQNDGAVPHQLTIARTDLAADALPTAGGLVDEAGLDVLGATGEFLGGESEDLSVELEAGSYVLFCNVAGHYDLGMHAGFTVE